MRKRIIIRAIQAFFLVVLLLASAATVYVWRTWDRSYDEYPVPDVRASTDPAVIARGEYLVFGPAHCVECHSSSFQEYQKVADGQKVPLQGGTRFEAPPLGAIYSRNLTPDPETGIGRYTDGHIARMMRYNVRPDGRASVAPMMPFHNMSDEDMIAIISFLRAQPPVRHQVPENEWTLPGKIIRSISSAFMPRDIDAVRPPKVAPEEKPTKERGEYLARYVGNCVGCHTPLDDTTFEPSGPEFSGGSEFEPMPLPGVDMKTWFRAPNITPQKGSAFMKFPDRATFVARFKAGGRQHAGTPMPWEAFARMSGEDVGAIYEFLRSISPSEGATGEVTFKKTD
jgi:mono/diheme cytochrome c family protein